MASSSLNPILPPISAIGASVIDGRMQNILNRQRILHRLHQALLDSHAAICDVIRADSGNSVAEAKVEYYCTLQHLKDLFHGREFNFEQGLQDEYAVARGLDAPARQVAVGLVVIRPAAYSRFYAILSPLATAIAAGNCVLLELESSLQTHNTDTLLKQLLPRALNLQAPIFTITPSSYQADSQTPVVELLQDSRFATSEPTSSQHLIHVPPSFENKSVAIVDRTADVDEAARAILTSRFNFQGKSPYAPDYVFVNEFVKKAFLHACMRHAIDKADDPHVYGDANPAIKSQRISETPLEKLCEKAKLDGCTILRKSARSTVIDVQDRNSELLQKKIREPVLLVHAYRSLEDVLDIAYKLEAPLVAAYIFSSLPVAKYLAQFVDTHVCCVNQVPIPLLVGPLAPRGFPVSLTQRYRPEMFCVPSPQYVSRPANAVTLDGALDGPSTSATTVSRLRALALTPLAPITQPEKNEALGYFEMALYTGLGTIVLPTVAAACYVAYRGVGFASKRLTR